jgi:hypothetical protein
MGGDSEVTNKPKAIGTRGESGVVKVARDLGFPAARRLALAGAADEGDVLLCPGVIVEVKAGKAAKTASLAQIDLWWLETERERLAHGATVGLLVVQRAGYSPDRAAYWRAFMGAPLMAQLQIVRGEFVHDHEFCVETTFAKALLMLRGYGYGEAL